MGALAAAALGFVAFAVLRDPGEAARADFLQLTAELGASVQDEWGRFRARLEHGALPVGRTVPRVEPVEIDPGDAFELTAFDALLGEARRAEFEEQAPERALELLREALERSDGVDLGRRAEALLRALVLADRLGDAAAARALWFDARHALKGHETRRGLPYLLLTGLAAARAIRQDAPQPVESAPQQDEAHAIAMRLLAGWQSGELALPSAPSRLGGPAQASEGDATQRAVDAARRRWPTSAQADAALAQLLAFLPDEKQRAAQLESASQRAQACRLVETWGEVPVATRRDTLELQRRGPLLLALRDDGEPDAPHAALYDASRVAAAFAEAATLMLPDGFLVEVEPSGDVDGELVRGRAELEAGFGFALRHRDPEAAMQGSSRRLQWLRAGLLGGGLLCFAAAWVTARALRREAHLGRLRRAFVASVSHELRTPVASILLLADNLREGVVAAPEAVGRYHALIGREARRLSRLVNDVLDMSRLERGEPARVRLVDTDLAAFHASLDEDLDELATRHALELRRASSAAGHARFDTEGLRRAILNLVENAMTHGGAPVLLSDTSDDETWQVEVRDHGGGVPPELRPRLFEAFAHAGEHAGTGLGLAIVAALAEAHGGSVEHHVPEGGGALFRLRLPREPVGVGEAQA